MNSRLPYDKDALRDIIESGGVKYRQSAGSYKFTCPRCGKADKLWIRKHDGVFRCWLCAESSNFKGRCEFALAEIYGESPTEYTKLIRGNYAPLQQHLELEFVDHWGEFGTEFSELEIADLEWPPVSAAWNEPGFAPGAIYLASRGIVLSTIKKYDIRYDCRDNRVQFPFKVGGALVGWQGRYCGPTKTADGKRIMKALTTIQDGIATKYLMFGDNLETAAHAVLAEGPVDALKAELCGGNVASLGKGVSEGQIQEIASRVGKLYIALDGDAATDIMRLSAMSRDYKLVPFLMRVPSHREDLGDCTYAEVFEAFGKATEIHGSQMMISIGGELFT